MKKLLICAFAFSVLSLSSFSQEIKYWEHFIEFENLEGFRYEGMDFQNGKPVVYTSEMNKGENEAELKAKTGGYKKIMCLKKWNLVANEGERPIPLTYYCTGSVENNKIYQPLYKKWKLMPEVSSHEVVARNMPEYVKSSLDNHEEVSMFETMTIRTESVIWKATKKIEYNDYTETLKHVSSDTVRVKVELPTMNGKLVSSAKYRYSQKNQALLLINGIRNKDKKFNESAEYAFIVIGNNGEIKGSCSLDFGYSRLIVDISEVFDYSSSLDGEFKGYAVVFGDQPVMRKKYRNPHKSEVDVVFINPDGTLGFKQSFQHNPDPTVASHISHAKVVMIDDVLYVMGKTLIGNTPGLFINKLDKSASLSSSFISSTSFHAVAHSEGSCHISSERKKATGSLKEHGGLPLTLGYSFVMRGAVNLGSKGVILYGQTLNMNNPTPQEIAAGKPNRGYGDMIALHITDDCKLENAWFGNITRDTKRNNTPNNITPYIISDNQIAFVSRREVDDKLPKNFKSIMLEEHYSQVEVLKSPQIPVLVYINLETKEVKNIEIEKEYFLPYPINNYHWQNPETKSIFIIGNRLSRTGDMEHPSLFLTEFIF